MSKKQGYEKMPAKVCGNCLYFCRHFIQYPGLKDFYAIDYGHCIYPRMKPRMAGESCPHFTVSQPEAVERSGVTHNAPTT